MDIAAKIEALEIKLAFQDDLVETLNGIQGNRELCLKNAHRIE